MNRPDLKNRGVHTKPAWAHEKASYGLRVLIALSVAMGLCWHLDQLPALPGVFLGIIASAIAETDDNWWGRTKSVALSLLCFVIAAAAVVELFAWPWRMTLMRALYTCNGDLNPPPQPGWKVRCSRCAKMRVRRESICLSKPSAMIGW